MNLWRKKMASRQVTAAAAASVDVKLKSVRFEVFGKVQGVFFRKNTKEQADNYGLVGWVQNTSRGTVVGVAQGPHNKLELMKQWLSEVGSKRSRIDKCVFKDEKDITRTEFKSFLIKR